MLKHVHLAITIIPLLLTLTLLAGNASASENTKAANIAPYQPSATVQQDIDKVLATAQQNDQQAMIVLGASWCHDSMGLAENFSKPDMQKLLSQHYQVLFVDVGFLQDRRAITRRFDYPTYFATPTVLIVDPESGTLVNRDSLAKWGNAASVSFPDYKSYLMQHANKQGVPLTDAQRDKLATLRAFSDAQVARLHKGYDHLSPMLKAYEAGKRGGPFVAVWNEVKAFRTQLQADIHQLRASLLANKDVSFPDYGPFSWE